MNSNEGGAMEVDKSSGDQSDKKPPLPIIDTVIELDSDDESLLKQRSKVTSKCINYDCKGGAVLQECPVFCYSFYRVKMKEGKGQEICRNCYNEAIAHFESLSTALTSQKYIIEQDCPLRNDLVEIIDSDEECEDSHVEEMEMDCYDDENLQFLSDNLVQVMNETMDKYKIAEQVDFSSKYMATKMDNLQKSFDEMDQMINNVQRSLDTLRSGLYTEYRAKTRSLPPLEISDVPVGSHQMLTVIPGLVSDGPSQPVPTPTLPPPPPPPAPSVPVVQAAPVPQLVAPPSPPGTSFITTEPGKVGERRSHRNISKPASYAEFTDPVDAADATDDFAPVVSEPITETDEQVLSTDHPVPSELPPKGEFVRTRVSVGNLLYGVKTSAFGAWAKVRILDISNSGPMPVYRVRYEGKKTNTVRQLLGKQLAYSTPSPVQLDVGTRVIAVFVDDANPRAENYFTGVIAEPLCVANDFRYLVFFDDGYAQYVTHNKVLVVCECSKFVWDDIHPDSRLFIKKYLDSYPERPMVKLHPGHVVKTEWNGKWWVARVLKVEGSLAQMYFDADARSEWIYRGSTRLGPLFLEMQAATNRLEKGPHAPRMINVKKNLPYVEYTRLGQDAEYPVDPPGTGTTETPVQPRAVARKSTANKPLQLPGGTNAILPFLPSQQVQQPQSKVVYFTPKTVMKPKPYVPHECSTDCKRHVTIPLENLKGYNPLSKPLLCGWYRIICKFKGKKYVRYCTPCAKSVRNLPELHHYLRLTGSDMSVDMFDFDAWVHCLAEFVLDKMYRSKKDISNGVEHVPIPVANYVDSSLPEFTNYSTRREPKEGVSLNLDEEFLCGCDCEDDCADKTKCQCWQLTIREFRTINKRTPDELIGYTYKRLPEFVTTGIYECNSRCKCSATCLNRVVQHPLQLKLQLFKTANRGWGIRSLNDIPQGAFICIYAGSLLTDKMANEGGVNYGDEYLAELDYIEVVERQKDGYESDVEEPDFDEFKQEEDDDDEEDPAILRSRSSMYEEDHDFRCSVSAVASDSPIKTRLRKRTDDPESQGDCSMNSVGTSESSQESKKNDVTYMEAETVTISDDEDAIREPSRFDPSSETTMVEPSSKFKSVRKMFGEDEVCYIMDAKNTGNIGRFLNHSCNPNVFVQNVFVDTHDLRFPWVAFFAMNYIRAGTELTWNYNYDVGSVPGKVIFCHCGSSECRGRLL